MWVFKPISTPPMNFRMVFFKAGVTGSSHLTENIFIHHRKHMPGGNYLAKLQTVVPFHNDVKVEPSLGIPQLSIEEEISSGVNVLVTRKISKRFKYSQIYIYYRW